MIGERRKALWLFLQGLDTVDIASRLNVTEAVAAKWVSEQRSEALLLPSPYQTLELALVAGTRGR